MSYWKEDGDKYSQVWWAMKDGRMFAADSCEELLGLISMWEMRGDDWNDWADNDMQMFDDFSKNPQSIL